MQRLLDHTCGFRRLQLQFSSDDDVHPNIHNDAQSTALESGFSTDATDLPSPAVLLPPGRLMSVLTTLLSFFLVSTLLPSRFYAQYNTSQFSSSHAMRYLHTYMHNKSMTVLAKHCR